MVSRTLAAGALILGLAACGSPQIERDDVASVVEGAFAAGDARATDIEVASDPIDGRWQASAEVDGRPLEVEVDADSGRVLSIDFGTEVAALTQKQLEDVASYADNPSADRARRRNWAVGLIALVVAVAGGLTAARQMRLREEGAGDGSPIPSADKMDEAADH